MQTTYSLLSPLSHDDQRATTCRTRADLRVRLRDRSPPLLRSAAQQELWLTPSRTDRDRSPPPRRRGVDNSCAVERRLIIPPSERTPTCIVCFEQAPRFSVNPDDIEFINHLSDPRRPISLRCGGAHSMCARCAKETIRAAIQHHGVAATRQPLLCPLCPLCPPNNTIAQGDSLSSDIIHSVIGDDGALLDKFERFATLAFLQSLGPTHVCYCPNRHCAEPLLLGSSPAGDDESVLAACLLLSCPWCGNCLTTTRTPWGATTPAVATLLHSANADDTLFAKWSISSHVRRCPRCGEGVIRDGGACATVKCARCATAFRICCLSSPSTPHEASNCNEFQESLRRAEEAERLFHSALASALSVPSAPTPPPLLPTPPPEPLNDIEMQ